MKMRIHNIFVKLIEISLWLSLVVVVFYIVISFEDRREEARDLDYIRDVAMIPIEADDDFTDEENLSEETMGEMEGESSDSSLSFDGIDRTINFSELQAINPDIIGWIYVPGTAIDYPVLQSGIGKPEDYYLRKTYDGKNKSCGSIYMQKINDSSFKSRLSILYGHNMKSGTMFADLHKFLKRDFFKDNKEVYIYTPTETISYEIFAVNERGAEQVMAVFGDMDELLSDVKESALYYRNVKQDPKRFLSLYTCGSGSKRVAIFCAEKERVDITTE